MTRKKIIYSIANRRLAKQLKRARIDAGLNQTDAAKQFGASQSFISKIENGQVTVGAVQLKVFSKLYGKDLNFFV